MSPVQVTAPGDERWQLYRVLSEPVRLRLLALAAAEELSIGELAELLAEGQPNVSRHAGALRQAGLLAERRQGTRIYLRLPAEVASDPVVADALVTGRQLVAEDGSLSRVEAVVRGRDQRGRDFFALQAAGQEPSALTPALPGYLAAIAPALARRGLAVDAGTGDGALLDLLSPLYAAVLAVDRSEVQLALARQRVEARGYANVTLLCAELEAEVVAARVGVGADLVVSARVLHHAPRPALTLGVLGRLARPGGHVVVIDYQRHDDERFGEQQADVWLGFDASELTALAVGAGLVKAEVRRLAPGYLGGGTDAHLAWQVLNARRAPARRAKERADRLAIRSRTHRRE